jgi:Na+/H+ antiporter NhaD/arsenite permease-like protein
MKLSKNTVETLGWYGMTVILLAYVLVSFSILSPTGYLYQFLNLTGALSLMLFSFKKKVRQSAFLNMIWAIIGLVTIINLTIHH